MYDFLISQPSHQSVNQYLSDRLKNRLNKKKIKMSKKNAMPRSISGLKCKGLSELKKAMTEALRATKSIRVKRHEYYIGLRI